MYTQHSHQRACLHRHRSDKHARKQNNHQQRERSEAATDENASGFLRAGATWKRSVSAAPLSLSPNLSFFFLSTALGFLPAANARESRPSAVTAQRSCSFRYRRLAEEVLIPSAPRHSKHTNLDAPLLSPLVKQFASLGAPAEMGNECLRRRCIHETHVCSRPGGSARNASKGAEYPK